MVNIKLSWVFLSLALLVNTGCAREPVPGNLAPYPPTQEDIEEVIAFQQEGFTIRPLATYDIQARVISIKSYSGSAQNKLAPLDFALGWGEMSDPLVYEKLNIRQLRRWYTYSWGKEGPPIPVSDITIQSANVHLIPKNDEILEQLSDINEGEIIRLKGTLVAVQQGQFSWKSSLSRKDTGDEACELFYVEEVTRLY